MLSWLIGIVVGLSIAYLFLKVVPEPAWRKRTAWTLIVLVLLYLLLHDITIDAWGMPASHFALIATAIGAVFIFEWWLLSRAPNSENKIAETSKRTAFLVLGVMFLLISIFEFTTPRLLRLVSKIPTPVGAIEFVPQQDKKSETLFSMPGKLHTTSGEIAGDKNASLRTGLERISRLSRYYQQQEFLTGLLVAEIKNKSEPVVLEPEESPFDVAAYEAAIAPLAGCMLELEQSVGARNLVTRVSGDLILALKILAAQSDNFDKIADQPKLQRLLGALKDARDTVLTAYRATIPATASESPTQSKGSENAASCAKLASTDIPEALVERLLSSARPATRPYLSLVISDLYSASGDNRSAVLELDRWLRSNAKAPDDDQWLQPSGQTKGFAQVDLKRISHTYRRAYRRVSMRNRMVAYLLSLPTRDELRVAEFETAQAEARDVLGSKFLRRVQSGGDCSGTDRHLIRILFIYVQNANNYAYHASLLDTHRYRPHRRKAEELAKFVHELDESCFGPAGDDIANFIKGSHFHTWALVTLAGMRVDVEDGFLDDLSILKRIEPVLLASIKTRDEMRRSAEKEAASDKELKARWFPSSAEELYDGLDSLVTHLSKIRRESSR